LDYATLPAHIQEQKDVRNIKLYNSYRREWIRNESDAKSQLASTIKNNERRLTFEKSRVSIHKHGEKVRAKHELNQVIEIL